MADELKRRAGKYPQKKQKRVLMLFCLVFMMASGLVILQNLGSKSTLPFSVTPISVMLPAENKVAGPSITEPGINRIHRFRLFLDSLETTVSGKRIRDSILLNRPHLYDSILYLDQLFYQPLKNQIYGK